MASGDPSLGSHCLSDLTYIRLSTAPHRPLPWHHKAILVSFGHSLFRDNLLSMTGPPLLRVEKSRSVARGWGGGLHRGGG
jgi:hypothetical protein